MPALFTSTSTGPKRVLDLAERAVDGVGVGDVGLHGERFAARGLDRRLRLLRRPSSSDE